MPYIDSDDDYDEFRKLGGFMNLFMINLNTIVFDSNNNKTYNKKQFGYICFNTCKQLTFNNWDDLKQNISFLDRSNQFIFYSKDRTIPFDEDYYEICYDYNFQDKCYNRNVKELSGGKRKR